METSPFFIFLLKTQHLIHPSIKVCTIPFVHANQHFDTFLPISLLMTMMKQTYIRHGTQCYTKGRGKTKKIILARTLQQRWCLSYTNTTVSMSFKSLFKSNLKIFLVSVYTALLLLSYIYIYRWLSWHQPPKSLKEFFSLGTSRNLKEQKWIYYIRIFFCCFAIFALKNSVKALKKRGSNFLQWKGKGVW